MLWQGVVTALLPKVQKNYSLDHPKLMRFVNEAKKAFSFQYRFIADQNYLINKINQFQKACDTSCQDILVTLLEQRSAVTKKAQVFQENLTEAVYNDIISNAQNGSEFSAKEKIQLQYCLLLDTFKVQLNNAIQMGLPLVTNSACYDCELVIREIEILLSDGQNNLLNK